MYKVTLWDNWISFSFLPPYTPKSFFSPAAFPLALSFLHPTGLLSCSSSYRVQKGPLWTLSLCQRVAASSSPFPVSSLNVSTRSESSLLKLSTLSESSFWWFSSLAVSCSQSFSSSPSHVSLLCFRTDGVSFSRAKVSTFGMSCFYWPCSAHLLSSVSLLASVCHLSCRLFSPLECFCSALMKRDDLFISLSDFLLCLLPLLIQFSPGSYGFIMLFLQSRNMVANRADRSPLLLSGGWRLTSTVSSESAYFLQAAAFSHLSKIPLLQDHDLWCGPQLFAHFFLFIFRPV